MTTIPTAASERVSDERREVAIEAAWEFIQPKLIPLNREKGLAGVWSNGFRSGYDAALRSPIQGEVKALEWRDSKAFFAVADAPNGERIPAIDLRTKSLIETAYRCGVEAALSSPAPEPIAEPVAWLKEWKDLNGPRSRVDLWPDVDKWLEVLSPTVTPLGRLTTPPDPKPEAVSDELQQAKAQAIDALLKAEDVWTDYGSGFRVHFAFKPNSDMGVVERINTARALTAALSTEEDGK